MTSGKTSQLTSNKTYDIRWPSSDRESHIVYELNGELQIFDVKTHKSTAISIDVPTDGWPAGPSRANAANLIETYTPEPQGRAGSFRGARRYLHGARSKKGRCAI